MNNQIHLDRLNQMMEKLDMSYEKTGFAKSRPTLVEIKHICVECGRKNTTYESESQILHSKTTDSYSFTCVCGHKEEIKVWTGA